MLPEKDRIRLLDMLNHAREALQFIESRTRPDLDKLRWLNLSLVRLLEIIGEAATEYPILQNLIFLKLNGNRLLDYAIASYTGTTR